tara:strand:+ start:1293 stop:2795 length:1503 start_codon:yes stop_codon:yes gene_type:complete
MLTSIEVTAAHPLAHRWILLLAVVFVASVWWVEFDRKTLDGDAACFVPAAVSLASGHGWTNPLYHPKAVQIADSPNAFVWHGFTSPWLWAMLAFPDSGPDSVRRSGIAVSLLGLVGFAMLLDRSTRRASLLTSLACAGLVVAVAPFLEHNGRPESVAATLGILITSSVVLSPSKWRAMVFGVGLPVAAVTHPIPAFLTVLFVVAIWLPEKKPVSVAMRDVACVALGGAMATVLLLLLFPYSPVDWLSAMMLHANAVVFDDQPSSFVRYWVLSPLRPLLILTFCASLVIPILLTGNEALRRMQLVRVMCVAPFLVAAWYFALRAPTRWYNLAPVIPVGMWFLYFKLTAYRWTNGVSKAFAPIVVVASLGLLSQVRSALIQVVFVQSGGITRAEARVDIREQLNALRVADDDVIYSAPLFEIRRGNLVSFSHQPEGDSVFILAQGNIGRVGQPPSYADFELVWHNFATTAPQIAGLPISNSPGGYSFAIYRSIPPEANLSMD